MRDRTVYMAVPLAYLIVTGLLPYVLRAMSPCWQDPSVSLSFDVCNVHLQLSYYSWLSLASMVLFLLLLYFLTKRTMIRLVIVGCLLAVIAMVGFWTYIPVLERDIATVPRYASDQTF